MSFRLEHKNKHGSFKIKLKRDVSYEEMNELCQLASNLIPSEPVVGKPTAAMGFVESSQFNTTTYGPHLPTQQGTEIDFTTQTKLGEYPVEKINMGTYREPDDGVRIKFVHFISAGRVPVFKIIKAATGISLFGIKEIVYGNYPCPKLTVDAAQFILDELRKLPTPVYAKIVSGTEAEAA